MGRSEDSSTEVRTPATARSEVVRFGTHLNESDALLWNIERDPCLRTTIVAVSILDRSPDWQRLRTLIDNACVQIPRLRQKVVATPFRLGPPRWQFDDQFDLEYHLRRVVAPAPGDLRSLFDLAGPIAMDAFDKDRPLWEFTLVEGLVDGRAAFIQKVHHSFTDGVGGMKLAQLMLDLTPDAAPREPGADLTDRHVVGPVASAVESVASNLRMAVAVATRGARSAPGLAEALVTRPLGVIDSSFRGARSVGKLLAPVTTPLSPVMTRRGMSRRLEAFDLPLDALRDAAHRADCTLNDAFLAGVTGGLYRYHEHHGEEVAALRVTMPINLRRNGDQLGNNRFVPARLTIPIGTRDATERMRELGALARAWRDEPALPFTDVIAGVLNRLPIPVTTTLFGGMLKAIDFVATNVPGVPTRVYLAGAEVVAEYAFAPPSGAALSIALLSHVDRCCIGITIDSAAVSDPDVLVTSLRQGFDDVLELRT